MSENVMLEKLKIKSLFGWLSVGLFALQLVTVFVSWLISAAFPELNMRSLLTGEGVRWFFSTYASNLLTPVLAWLLLGGMAYGSLSSSRFFEGVFMHGKRTQRQKFALQVVAFEAFIVMVLILILTLWPHAVLLGVTGQLFPSSFSVGIIPVLCFCAGLMGVSYGYASGLYNKVEDFLDSLTCGIADALPLFLCYVLSAELWGMINYVCMGVGE